MSQNRSSAVMQQRSEPRDSLEYFPTPCWATRALCEHVIHARGQWTVWEPACGEGHMARALAEYFRGVYASDVHNYGYGVIKDFLFPTGDEPECDWIITNPPFRLAEQFIHRGLERSKRGVAVLVRVAFLEGITRYKQLFSPYPPDLIAQFTERVPMVKGRVDQRASTATAYCWLVWGHWAEPCAHPDFMWIKPCRKQLERPGDYE